MAPDPKAVAAVMRAICCPIGGCAAEKGGNACWAFTPRYKKAHEAEAKAAIAAYEAWKIQEKK